MLLSAITLNNPHVTAALIAMLSALIVALISATYSRKQLKQTKELAKIAKLSSEKIAKQNVESSEKIAEQNLKSTKVINNETIKNLEERRYTDTIIIQRIEWVNKIRNTFIDFNSLSKNTFEFLSIALRTEQGMKMEEFIKRTHDLDRLIDEVYLLSNPREYWFERLFEHMNDLRNYIIDVELSADPNLKQFRDYISVIVYIQQCILKSEWKRTKEEINSGDETSPEKMEKIFYKTAKEINPALYERLFSHNFNLN
ncbi:hypothetical protein [Terribacillus saccharophilus]|uniref:Uncharacterized protein n=1 Tax=Terribacillus saccharophilus TaxID=361277 RepID=A0ABX4H0W2_9BACI|nr:hypothetical protein [Terribacillus saccharophilus]PAD36321.1 hypothetical protein CHH56_04830 [Terribacillus saccharophilus]PAD95037.1 hypothetical protein CHH50_15655 [Terribacillus saccharophilus]PAE00740.1 hypothetical protein CHH48_05535 [Terribacillus saccharophilus]